MVYASAHTQYYILTVPGASWYTPPRVENLKPVLGSSRSTHPSASDLSPVLLRDIHISNIAKIQKL